MLRKKDDDPDDEGKENTVENRNQTSEGPDGRQTKLSTSSKDKREMAYSIRKRKKLGIDNLFIMFRIHLSN